MSCLRTQHRAPGEIQESSTPPAELAVLPIIYSYNLNSHVGDWSIKERTNPLSNEILTLLIFFILIFSISADVFIAQWVIS